MKRVIPPQVVIVTPSWMDPSQTYSVRCEKQSGRWQVIPF